MNLNYVEIDPGEHRHIVGRILNGKSKGQRQGLTVCGMPFNAEESIIYASPSSSLMGQDDARPPCPACNGADEVAPEEKEQPRMSTTVVDIPLEEIHPSPFNHRRVFRDMEQLAESIKARGVLQPVTVRKNGKGYELVFGERRYRATKLAGVDSIPAIVRTMSDVEVLEAQLIENVQRSDVHALEEADGYKELLDKHKYDVETIAAKTGKSKAYIYARLKLCALAPGPRKAFLDDKLNPSVALLIARIPDVKLQQQALEEILKPSDFGNIVVDDDDGQREIVPLSLRHAQAHIRDKYMLRLDQASFDITDAQLVAKAGACTACPHRTGNQRELFAEVKSADLCTNPPCFESKKNADWDKRAQAATREGVRVLNAKETAHVFTSYDKTTVGHESAYIDPNRPLPYALNPRGSNKTWKQLLGKEQAAKVLVRDGAGNARVLLDKKSAIAKLEKTGKLKELKREARSASSGASSHNAEQKKRQDEAKRKRETVERAVTVMVGELESTGGIHSGAWPWLAKAVLHCVDAEDAKRVIGRRAIEVKGDKGQARALAEKVLGAWIDDKRTVADLQGLVVELLATNRSVGVWQNGYGDDFTGAVKAFDLDLKKLPPLAAEKAKAKPAAKAKKKAGAK